MNQVKKITAIVLVLVLAVSLAACGASPQKKLIGAWRDSTGGLGFDFNEDGTVKLHFVHFTIPIVNFTVDDDIDGTYTVTQAEDKTFHLTVDYKVTLVSLSDEYTFEIDKDILKMTNVKSGNTYTLTRYDASADTTESTSDVSAVSAG